jgi:hypothetical protein
MEVRAHFTTTVLLALVGCIAGALPGVLVTVGGTHGNRQAQRVRARIEEREPLGMRMEYRELAVWSGFLGAIGGMIGATIGWLAGGFRDPTVLRAFAAAAGAMWAFDGAAFGVVTLGLPGLLVGSLLFAAVATFLGAILGRFGFLLLVKPLLWLVVPHF